MTTFNEREQGFEAKFVHDQNTEFRIKARRNHLLGLWAGGLLGLKGDELALYTGTVLSADLANWQFGSRLACTIDRIACHQKRGAWNGLFILRPVMEI